MMFTRFEPVAVVPDGHHLAVLPDELVLKRKRKRKKEEKQEINK
jgi:hypothetical protein